MVHELMETGVREASAQPGAATIGVRSRQGERCFSMELRMTSSLRMHAVRASFLGLPAASSR